MCVYSRIIEHDSFSECWKNEKKVGLTLSLVLTMAASAGASSPVADAGLPRYAAEDAVCLDGTDSYDPDNSGALSYQWRQISLS